MLAAIKLATRLSRAFTVDLAAVIIMRIDLKWSATHFAGVNWIPCFANWHEFSERARHFALARKRHISRDRDWHPWALFISTRVNECVWSRADIATRVSDHSENTPSMHRRLSDRSCPFKVAKCTSVQSTNARRELARDGLVITLMRATSHREGPRNANHKVRGKNSKARILRVPGHIKFTSNSVAIDKSAVEAHNKSGRRRTTRRACIQIRVRFRRNANKMIAPYFR